MVTSNPSLSQASSFTARTRGVAVTAAPMPPDLEKLLAFPSLLVAIHRFSKSELNNENIEFLNAVNQFKKNPSLLQARDIYKIYIVGSKMINIASSVKKLLNDKFNEELSLVVSWDISSAFDDAKKEILILVNRDTYQRFKKTLEYQNTMRSLGFDV